MTAQIGDYVRASFDFPKDEVSDLSLSLGDLVRIIDVIDENWAFGKKVGLDDLCGNFPLAYVERITLPSTCVDQKLFLALEDFPFEQNGDLELKKGDIILGLEAVDDTWWKGQNGSQKGIFPLSIVVELNVENENQPRPYIKNCLNSHPEEKSGTESDTLAEGGPKIKEVIYARALVDVIPQRDGELAFGQGDLIEITETVDRDWLYGQFGSKKGFVSAACVQVLNGGNQFKSNNYSDNNVILNTDVSCLGALSTYTSQNDAESLKLESSENRLISLSSQFNAGIKLHNIETVPYGRVKQNFISQDPSELSLKENNIVFLIKHIDPDWTEGEVDGKRGVFPTSYIEIIGDCQNASNPDLKESQSSTKSYETAYSKHHDIGGSSMKTVTASCSYKCDSDTDMMNMGTSAHTIIGDNKLNCTGNSSTISADPSENISDQCSQSQTKYKGYRKNSAPSILTIKPALPLKPANPRKPPVASKPSITGKPSTLTNFSSLQAMKLTEASTQISNTPMKEDNTPKTSSIIHYFEDKIAKSKTTDRIQSPPLAQKKTEGTLNVSVQYVKTARRKSHLDLSEFTVSDMNMNTCSVSFHRPTRTAPTRPAVTSPGFGISEASTVKTQGPLPHVSTILTAVSSESVPAVKHVRKRQSPEGHSNRTQIMRRSTQPMTSYRAQSPPRQPVRPTSFPSAPKRPPPRPAGYVLYSPRGQIIEEDTTLSLVINIREKLQAITDGIKLPGDGVTDAVRYLTYPCSKHICRRFGSRLPCIGCLRKWHGCRLFRKQWQTIEQKLAKRSQQQNMLVLTATSCKGYATNFLKILF